MIKILFVSNSSSSMIFFRKGILNYLMRNGYEVHIIAPKDYKTDKLKEMGCIFHQVDFQTKNKNPIKESFLLYKLYKHYKKIKPNIIFHYTIKPNTYGTLAAKLLGIHSVAIITGLGYSFLENNLINKVVKFLYKNTLKYASSVWFLNQEDKSKLISNKIISEEKSFILPGEGVDTVEFCPVDNTRDKTIFVFLMLARVVWFKGVKEFVEAAQIIKGEFKNVQFLLCGETNVDNPNSISLETIEDWNRRGMVEYIGLSNDVRNEIAIADCIVLPSYTEGLSKVLMEAASMEKPLIASNLDGCKQLIEDGKNGYLSEVKSSISLANSMRKMLSLSKEELDRMGKIGRAKMKEHYDERIIIDHYMNFINKIIK